MILGFVKIKNGAVETHRDSFILSNLSVVSVRRPYLAGAMLLSGAALGFGGMFSDILYTGEIFSIAGFSFCAVFVGSQVGQLSLLSRDLKGTEIANAVWGHHKSLQHVRRNIVQAMQAERTGGDDAATK